GRGRSWNRLSSGNGRRRRRQPTLHVPPTWPARSSWHGRSWSGSPVPRSPASPAPLAEMGALGADRGGGPVPGVHQRLVGQTGEELALDAVHDLREARVVPSCGTRATGEQGVAGEEHV